MTIAASLTDHVAVGDDTSIRELFFQSAEEHHDASARLSDLVDRAESVRKNIDRATDPIFKRFHTRQLERVLPEIDAVKTRMNVIVARVQQLQRDYAEVPHAVDDLAPGLPGMRERLGESRQHLKRLSGLADSGFGSGAREQRIRELKAEVAYLERKIRRRESRFLTALKGEEDKAARE